MILPPHNAAYPRLDEICAERLQTYGKRLSVWRRLRQVALADLANLSGVPAGRIRRLELGHLPRARLTDILKLTIVLGIDPAQLFADYHPHDHRQG